MSKRKNTPSEIKSLYSNFPGKWSKVDMNILFDMYLEADEYGKDSLFFVLLNEYISLNKIDKKGERAHIAYLISYLLLNIIYVENREEIALVFAEKANELSETEECKEWIYVVREDLV